jgi:hypothetical protein
MLRVTPTIDPRIFSIVTVQMIIFSIMKIKIYENEIVIQYQCCL